MACGKTRLALEVARRQRYHFADGVYFVPLSALGTGSSLLAALAERLGFTFRDKGEHQQQLLDYLRNKKLLLVLDSFETVTESAGLVAEILAASAGSKLLVTSRVRLDLSGEQVYPIKGMNIPPIDGKQVLDYSAVALFLEAARRVKPGYLPEDLDGIARICRVVEGMPLSLILAASWVGEYPTQEIAEQIERSLDFLSVEWADLPARQRSLRATFEYSWDLLSLPEKQVLMKLSVFRNAFSAQTAFEVAGASPKVLHALVSKSLLGSTSEGQYQMHDLVRQYSQEKLTLAEDGVERATRQTHSEYFLGIATGWSSLFKGPGQIAMLAQADKQIDDVKAAWDWACQQGEIDRLTNGLEGLCLYYELSARFKEGQGACQAAADGLAGADTPQSCFLQAHLRIWQSRFSRLLGELEPAQQAMGREPGACQPAGIVWSGYPCLAGLYLAGSRRSHLYRGPQIGTRAPATQRGAVPASQATPGTWQLHWRIWGSTCSIRGIILRRPKPLTECIDDAQGYQVTGAGWHMR